MTSRSPCPARYRCTWPARGAGAAAAPGDFPARRSPRWSRAPGDLNCPHARPRCPGRRGTGTGRPCTATRQSPGRSGHQERGGLPPARDRAAGHPGRSGTAAVGRRRPGRTSSAARPATGRCGPAARTGHRRREASQGPPRATRRCLAPSGGPARRGAQARIPGPGRRATPGRYLSCPQDKPPFKQLFESAAARPTRPTSRAPERNHPAGMMARPAASAEGGKPVRRATRGMDMAQSSDGLTVSRAGRCARDNPA